MNDAGIHTETQIMLPGYNVGLLQFLQQSWKQKKLLILLLLFYFWHVRRFTAGGTTWVIFSCEKCHGCNPGLTIKTNPFWAQPPLSIKGRNTTLLRPLSRLSTGQRSININAASTRWSWRRATPWLLSVLNCICWQWLTASTSHFSEEVVGNKLSSPFSNKSAL